jgi:hypothetical protein
MESKAHSKSPDPASPLVWANWRRIFLNAPPPYWPVSGLMERPSSPSQNHKDFSGVDESGFAFET